MIFMVTHNPSLFKPQEHRHGSHLGEHALGVLLVEGHRGEGDLDEHLVVGAASALA